jgi:hypothetical protein
MYRLVCFSVLCLFGYSPFAFAAPARSASNTYIPCLPDPVADHLTAERAPSRCSTLGPTDSFAAASNLRSLHWSKWGSDKATARGVDIGFHADIKRVNVRVIASRARISPCGDYYIYTRLTVHSRYGARTQSLSDIGSC